MSRREQQKTETRARLIRTAYLLFSRKGITATKTLDVAKKAGVSHGTVFAHFETRDELTASVISEYAKRVMRRIHDLVAAGAGLSDVLRAHLEGLSEYEPFYARLVTEGPTLEAYVRNTLLGIQSAISAHMAVAAEVEMKAGSIRTMPFHLLFNTWLGLVHHYVVNRDLFAPRRNVLVERREELIGHFMRLLAP